MLTKLSQWIKISFCSLLHEFVLESHDSRHFQKARWCSLLDTNFKTLAYVITPHQVHLSKMTKHWDSFVSHCTYEVNETVETPEVMHKPQSDSPQTHCPKWERWLPPKLVIAMQVRTLQCTEPYNSRNRHSVSNGLGSWVPLNPQIRGYYIGNYTVCQRIWIWGMPRVPGG